MHFLAYSKSSQVHDHQTALECELLKLPCEQNGTWQHGMKWNRKAGTEQFVEWMGNDNFLLTPRVYNTLVDAYCTYIPFNSGWLPVFHSSLKIFPSLSSCTLYIWNKVYLHFGWLFNSWTWHLFATWEVVVLNSFMDICADCSASPPAYQISQCSGYLSTIWKGLQRNVSHKEYAMRSLFPSGWMAQ